MCRRDKGLGRIARELSILSRLRSGTSAQALGTNSTVQILPSHSQSVLKTKSQLFCAFFQAFYEVLQLVFRRIPHLGMNA